jgi:hypothetical protein
VTSKSPRVTGHWDLNNHKGYYAEGLVDAIALAAGLDPWSARRDIAIDRSIATPGPRGSKRDPRINVQVKCWTPPVRARAEPSWHYPLKLSAWADLAGPGFQVPRYLLLCIVPGSIDDYVSVRPDEVGFRHAVYWRSLRDEAPMDPPEVDRRKPIDIPKVQLLTPDSLNALVEGREAEAIVL